MLVLLQLLLLLLLLLLIFFQFEKHLVNFFCLSQCFFKQKKNSSSRAELRLY